jgi:hypothetical protein
MASTQLQGKQREMLQLRFDVLDTYVKRAAVAVSSWFEDGRLVIVDLTDPFVDRKYTDQVLLQALTIPRFYCCGPIQYCVRTLSQL